jgi:Fe-S cluster assembly protein SufD
MDIKNLTENYSKDLEQLVQTQVQKDALESFLKRGLPHTKMEDWLYTKTHDVLPENFKKVEDKGLLKSVKVAGKYQVVFLNGQYSKTDSFFPEEISVELKESTLDNTDKEDIFAKLNHSANSQVLEIKVPKNFRADDTITIVHISSFESSFATPRIHVELGTHAEVEFVEYFTGDNEKSYNNISVVTFDLDAGARSKHIKVQDEGNKAFHVASTYAYVKRDANFKSFTFNTGGLKARHNLHVYLNETGAEASVDGLYTLKGNQHCDNFSFIKHAVEHTNSSQLFKGVLDGSSRAAFTGKVYVDRDAQQINSEQLNKNLLLTKKAHVDTRPQLEVYADDVKCAHGATVGQMNEEEAFYLQSRGLSRERAQKLLIHAYCSETLLKIENDKIENFLSEILFESFEKEAFEHIDSQEANL